MLPFDYYLEVRTKINNIARSEKAGTNSRRVFNQIEPNWPLPYSTVPVPLLRDATGWQAGSTVSVQGGRGIDT